MTVMTGAFLRIAPWRVQEPNPRGAPRTESCGANHLRHVGLSRLNMADAGETVSNGFPVRPPYSVVSYGKSGADSADSSSLQMGCSVDRFAPGTRNGQPVPMTTTIDMAFALR